MGNELSRNQSIPSVSDESPVVTHRFRLLGLGQVSLLISTWMLWIPQTTFPQVPLISVASQIPQSVEWGLGGLLLTSVGIVIFAWQPEYQRPASLLIGASTLGLVLIDQHRLQPWAWQFVILSFVLAVADADTAFALWRCLVIGIYAWSAWSKMDHGFCVRHGPFLLDGLVKSIGVTEGTRTWPATVRYAAAATIPLFEFLIAAGLCWPKTRRIAVIAASMMHVGLLLALGPFGHGHQPGVLLWNLFFLVQNWFLFVSEPVIRQRKGTNSLAKTTHFGNSIAKFAVIAVMAWPLLEPIGMCDHWPAWAVYAAKPERVDVFVEESEIGKLPDHLKPYVGPPDLEGWCLFRIDRWSLDAVHAPVYPQDRFQVGVALAIANEIQSRNIRIVIQGPANRWTGARTFHEYTGRDSIERKARTSRLNAIPRTR